MKKLIIILLILTSCEANDLANREIMFIRSGKHKCQERTLRAVDTTKPLTGAFLTGSTWIYSSHHDTGWNKLIGVSFGNVHSNSSRIGWRCTDNKIYICGYYYANGERHITERVEVAHMAYYNFSIFGGCIRVWGSGIDVTWIHAVDTRGKGWMCYPYFGGESVAPHEMQFNFNLITNK